MCFFQRVTRAFVLVAVLQLLISVEAVAQDQQLAAMKRINPRLVQQYPPALMDDEVLAANGIQKIAGQHLILYTDVRDRSDVDELTVVFDQAVNQWCQYFSIDPRRAAAWQMRAFVIQDRSRFRKTGLMPADLPDFLAGYQRGSEMWVYLQPGNYYTRHLLLHEGTHAFMDWFLDGFGSPWYSEGMAELLSLNRWDGERVQLNHHVNDRSESEYWGRVKVLRTSAEQGELPSLDDVLQTPNSAFRKVESYAWAWAVCEFFDQHTLSKKAFSELDQRVRQPGFPFNQALRQSLKKQWPSLQRDWFLFVDEVDYGYDAGKSRLISARPLESPNGLDAVEIRADHGWQRTTIAVNAGDQVRIRASGRFQVGETKLDDQTTIPWPCEANGITLEYYRGRPLGILLAGTFDSVLADSADPQVIKQAIAGLISPIKVGNDSVIQVATDGILCLRVNDSPSRMQDNSGVLEVSIEKLK